MIFKGLGKKYKRIMAFVLATALFFNAWIDYGFSVFAEEEGLKVSFVGSAQVEYSGDVFAPEFSVVVANDETISVSDYVAVWKKGEEVVTEIKDAGTYILTVTANIKTNPDSEETEEMTGTGTFTVTPIDLTNCEIVVDSSFSAIYDGSEKQPTEGQIRLERNGNTIAKENYTLGITPATNVGESITVTATVTDGNVNHTGSKSSSIDIQPLEFSENNITIEGLEASYPYTDNAITPEITVKGNNVTWVEDADYTVSYLNNRYISTNESSANVVITRLPNGANSKNYAGETITKSFEIVPLGGVSEISVSGTQNDGYTEWYTGEVTLTAPEGCTIGTDLSEKENWSNTLVIPVSQVVSYYLKNANGYITAVRNIDIKIDGTCPVMDTLTVTEEEVWTQEKTIPVKVSDDNLSRVYYTLDGVVTELSFEDGITNLETEIKITKEIFDAAGKEVTVIAIDKAGNTVSKTVNVKNIDRTAPAFDTNTLVEYWTNQDSFTFSLGMSESDEQSGLASIILKNEVENVIVRINEEDGEATVTGNNGEQIPEGIKEYTFVATDNAGNSLEKTFTIKVDRTAPSVQIDTDKLGENGYFKEDIYWFADANLEISLNLENTGNLDEAQKAAYKVEYSTVPFEEGKDDYAIVDLAQAKINVALVEGVTTYYFRAVDEAGNKSDVQSVKAGYDATVPVISKVEINGINAEDGWVNSAEAVDGKVQFTVSAEDEQTGIFKIQYSLDGGINYQDIESPTVNGNDYIFALDILEGRHNLKIQAVNNVKKSVEKAITEFTGVDKTAPEEVAYIQFTSDSIGDNDGGTQNDNGTWSSILGVVTNKWNKIWGKETISFEVYVKDEISGIKELKMKYGNVPISDLTLVEGIQVFTSEEELIGYTVYSGEITTSEETLVVSDFKIESITDIAGNQSGIINLVGADGSDFIYLDSVAPLLELSVVNEDWDGSFDKDKTYFTNKEDVSIVLTMDERFFEEKDHPEVVLTANGVRVEGQSNNAWDKVVGEAYKWQKKVALTKNPGEETEYQISIEKYADPSGNLMTGQGAILNAVTDGAFVSSTFVVDDTAPTLEYSTEGEKCSVADKLVFDTGEGLTVNVGIGDQYFDENNLSVKLIKEDGSEETLTKVSGENSKLVYKYNESGEYKVEVSYVDKAGNLLTAKEDGSLEEGQSVIAGTYTSKDYVIDHESPKFAVEYSTPVEVVKVVNDVYKTATVAVPQAEYTAYYADNIELKFTIDEDYINYNENNGLEHYSLEVLKQKNDGTFAVVSTSNGEEKDVNVTWAKEEETGAYVATIVIKTEEDHSTDGIYKVSFTSNDCAGNSMAAKYPEDVSVKGLIAEGVYTSPELILDTTAPSSDILVQFTSDCIGENTGGTLSDGKWTSGILSMSNSDWGIIWGREEIQFKVYVNDTLSGIKKINDDQIIKISYNGNGITDLAVNTKVEKDKNYTVYTGKITCDDKKELAIENNNFKVDFVKDIAGNTTENISFGGKIYLDHIKPVFSADLKEVYWINGEFSLDLGVNDNVYGNYTAVSGVKYPITVSTEEGIKTKPEGDNKVTFSAETPGSVTYRFIAKDYVGNVAEESFTVKTDTSSPQLDITDVSGTNEAVNPVEPEVTWFSDPEIKFSVSVNDMPQGENVETTPYWVEYSVDNFKTVNRILNNSTQGNKDFTLKADLSKVSLENGKVTYSFRVADEAGYVAKGEDVKQITVGYDGSTPEITDVVFTQKDDEKNDNWLNAAEIGENDNKVELSVGVKETDSGIKTLEYSIDGGKNYTEAQYIVKEGKYVFTTEEAVPQGEVEWKLRVTNYVNTDQIITISDPAIVDTLAPVAEAMIRFSSDITGENYIDKVRNEKGWISQILDMMETAWNKIWGKEKVSFEVYVRDDSSEAERISEVGSVELKYTLKDTDKVENVTLTPIEGVNAVIEDEALELETQGYSIFIGEIICEENTELVVSDFTIDTITDIAGNVQDTDIILKEANTEVIYLDRVNPVLEVSLNENCKKLDDDARYYANQETSMTLTITERFFADTKNKPEITLERSIDAGKTFKVVAANGYTTSRWSNVVDNKSSMTITLPTVAGEEAEYRVKMTYEDPSENLLVESKQAGAKVYGTVTDGKYTSDIIVVDDVAPTLTYTVAEEPSCMIGESAVYDNAGDEDLKVIVVIEDTPEYFNFTEKINENNLHVSVRDAESHEILKEEFKLSEKVLNGKEHTYVFNCEEKIQEIQEHQEFYVQVEYTDRAGNKLVAKTSDNNATGFVEDGNNVNDGIYQSNKYIIDNVAPVFSLSYGKDARIISKSSDGWTEEDGVTPKKGSDAYFNDGIEVTFTIEDKFTKLEDGAIDHHILQVMKNGATVYSSVVDMAVNEVTGEDESIANQDIGVVWINTGDVYTAKVTIPKVKDHSTDGEYQIVFANEDCAGNKMTVKDSDDITVKGLFADGTYTSPKLILDTKEPEAEAFVKFASDVTGDNQLTDQILSMAEAKEVEIWGKNEINFEVYVYDTYSGVKEINANKDDSITMSYKVGSETFTVVLTEAEAKKANVNPDDLDVAYTVYTGRIVTEPEEEFVITDFQIDKIWDVAGNETTSPIVLDGTIYMDDVSPKLEVGYTTDAYQLIDMSKEGWETAEGKTPQEGLTAFYNNDIEVTLTISENTTKTITINDGVATESALEHHKLVVMKDGKAVYTSEVGMNNDASSIGGEDASGISVVWSKNDSNKEDVTYTAEVTISADKSNHLTDGDYQVTFATKDCTGNIMEAKEGSDITVTDGTYTSPVLVLDTTAPEVKAAYVYDQDKFVRKIQDKNGNDRDYFNGSINLNITVKDRNVRYSELTNVLSGTKALNIEDKVVKINDKDYFNADAHLIKQYLDEKYTYHAMGNVPNPDKNLEEKTFILNLNTDANYTIPIDFHDLAGNRAEISVGEEKYTNGYTEYVTVDATKPRFTYKVVGALDNQPEENGNSTGVNYDRTGTFSNMIKDFLGFFFQTKGMEIVITVEDDISGAFCFTYSSQESSGMSGRKESAARPGSTFQDKISVGTMKGQIAVTAFDYSDIESTQTVGAFIVETQTGEIIFDDSATMASREEGNEKYYNKDVDMKVTFNEKDAGESGIDKLEVRYDDTIEATEEYKGKGGKITYELTTDKPITTTKYNKNNIMVSASMTDNSGNVSEKEHTTIYNIDVTAPTIKVTYDNNEPYNENFYNKARVATVEITERNFDENDVVWKITSSDGPEPIIGSWSHSGEDDDSNVHTCTVTFEEDSDYTFTLEFEDKAGNKADYSQVDEFTIDKTLPVMEVTYNNNEYLNEYYYNASRTATIDILEHNFDPEGIQIHVTADNATGGASISGWTRNGDHNIATVTFANDAEYTLDIEGVDLANNELEDYEQDHFVVDQTVPELEIYDIENMSANKGEVRPAIRYYDTNYDAEGTVVVFKGYHNGEQEMEGDKSLQANGLELKLHDIPHVQENDDIYTMEATVYDLAGNSSEASVMFSVNRFGSVYTFDEATKALVGEGGKYYTNEEQDIVIVETNVDTLEFKEITCNLNGKLSTLKEGEDFDVYVDGTEATWKQYTYRIFEDNFREEGTYIITTYSEDKATNTSDNNSKGKSVEFVMDKTSPSVLISGVEDGGQYREDKHEMTIDIEDNVRIAEMIVDINGVETRFNTAQINEVDGKITMDIDSDNQWQVIKVTVVDAAGNVTNADEISVLVTANLFVQFVSNKIALYSTIGVAGTGTVAAWWFMFRKRKITGAS